MTEEEEQLLIGVLKSAKKDVLALIKQLDIDEQELAKRIREEQERLRLANVDLQAEQNKKLNHEKSLRVPTAADIEKAGEDGAAFGFWTGVVIAVVAIAVVASVASGGVAAPAAIAGAALIIGGGTAAGYFIGRHNAASPGKSRSKILDKDDENIKKAAKPVEKAKTIVEGLGAEKALIAKERNEENNRLQEINKELKEYGAEISLGDNLIPDAPPNPQKGKGGVGF